MGKIRNKKSEIKNQKSEVRRYFCLLLSVFCLLSFSFFVSTCLAEELRLEVSLNKDRISLGSTANLNITFYGAQDVSAPDLPDIYGFEWRYLGPSTRISIVNGRMSSSITHTYILIPHKEGDFSIPPLSIFYKGKIYNSKAIPIEVVKGPVTASSPRSSSSGAAGGIPTPTPPAGPIFEEEEEMSPDEAIPGLSQKLFLTLEASKRSAYINEIIPVRIKLYIDRTSQFSLREIQYPEFGHEGFSVEQFGEPKEYEETVGGVPYHVIEFRTNAFGTHAGALKLGPAATKFNLLVRQRRNRFSSIFDDDFFGPDPFDRFFGGYKKYLITLKSPDLNIMINELPKENVPADFDGALGNYQFNLEAEPKEARAGDPITVKITITGSGNFTTVKLPKADFGDDFKVYDPEVKQDATGKIFEQAVIPKSETVKEIPKFIFSFFDTKTGTYKEITRGPIPIKVNPLPPGEESKIFERGELTPTVIQKEEALGRDIIYIKDTPGTLNKIGGFLCFNRFFAWIQVLPLMSVVAVLILNKRKERLEKDTRYARRLRAPHKAKKNLAKTKNLLNSKEPASFYDSVFKTLKEYIGDKFHLPSAGITAIVVEELKKQRINPNTLAKLKECFEKCDIARYAPSAVTKEEMQDAYKLLVDIIDELERIRV